MLDAKIVATIIRLAWAVLFFTYCNPSKTMAQAANPTIAVLLWAFFEPRNSHSVIPRSKKLNATFLFGQSRRISQSHNVPLHITTCPRQFLSVVRPTQSSSEPLQSYAMPIALKYLIVMIESGMCTRYRRLSSVRTDSSG